MLSAAVVALALLGWIALPAGLARAEVRVTVASGAWCAAETWSPAGAPGAGDQLQIAPGHEVVLDGACEQVAADVTIGGYALPGYPESRGRLTSAGGQTLRVGDPIAPYVIQNRGVISLAGGDRLEIDCDEVDATYCAVENTAGGRFTARGTRVASGRVAAVVAESCPANSDFRPDVPGFRATDCEDVVLEVALDGGDLGAIADDDPRLVGRLVRVGGGAQHRGTWYAIAETRAPDRLVLDYKSEGQQAQRGVGPVVPTGAAAVAQGSDRVTWTAGIGATDATASLGAWFVCDADCPAVVNDSPFPGASEERLPCGAARRIVDVPFACDGGTCSGTSDALVLESGYPTPSCDGGAPARIIGSSANTGYSAVDYVERFAAGDPFVVWDPVALTVPEANRHFAPVQQGATGGMRVNDDSVIDLEGVRISFWGRGDTAIEPGWNAVQSRFTPANATGGIRLRHVEIAHFGGGEAIDWLNVKNGLGANEDVTVRDPLPTDQGEDPARGHGLWINQYNYAGGGGKAVVVRFRGTRLGDDCIVVNGDSRRSPDRFEFARITLDHPTCTFASTLGQRPSAQCFDFQDWGLAVRDGVDLVAPLCTNYANGGFMWSPEMVGAARSGRFMVSDGVFQNMRGPCAGGASRPRYGALRVLVVNTLCRALSAHTVLAGADTDGIYGADVYSSYVADAGLGIVDADVARGAFVRLGARNGSTGLSIVSREPWNFTDSNQSYADVAVLRPACPPGVSCPVARGLGVGDHDATTSDLSVSHATFAGLAGVPGGAAWQASDNADALLEVRDSVAWSIRNVFLAPAPAPNVVESHTLSVGAEVFCSPAGPACPAPSPTTLLTGDVSVRDLARGDLTPLPGTTPLTMATSDGTPAGARVAGPASWTRIERVLPAAAALGRPGVRIPAYDRDSDADGVYDLHDDCPAVPIQALIQPGAPGACERYGPGCSADLEGVPTACGLGECASTGVCTNGVDTCEPAAPEPERCDGLDNDCNGAIDDADTDGDGVPDCEDNCVTIPNPRVAPGYLDANPWATLTGGQRDDDHDGFGNRCDADFTETGDTVGGLDLARFRAASGHSRALDACGALGAEPCAIYDLDEQGDAISGADLGVFRALSGSAAGPKCDACPLACTAGSDGSCD